MTNELHEMDKIFFYPVTSLIILYLVRRILHTVYNHLLPYFFVLIPNRV